MDCPLSTPFSKYSGKLRQITPESSGTNGYALLQVCAPGFFPHDDAYRLRASGQIADFPRSTTHFVIADRPFRRWSGDSLAPNAGTELPRRRYFSVCEPDSSSDGGTLAEELNAYREPSNGLNVEFLDLLDNKVATALGTSTSPTIALLVKNPEQLIAYASQLGEELNTAIAAAAHSGHWFVLTLGTVTVNPELDGVLDLRRKDAQAWFFETFVRGRIITTRAKRFEDVLPELVNQSIGGTDLEESKLQLQYVAHALRGMGVYALIYPSARTDSGAKYRDGEVVDWHGWCLVLFGNTEQGRTLFVDLGGWETEFPKNVHFNEEIDDDRRGSSWTILGLTARNHISYSYRQANSRTDAPHARPESQLGEFAFASYEIVQECEEENAHGGRSWYMISNAEVVWYPPLRRYMLLADLQDGRIPAFDAATAPYEIERPTHSRFDCMLCATPMVRFHDFDRGKEFFGKATLNRSETLGRAFYRCFCCGWWLVDMAYKDYADDDSAWSLNESIYVQGAIRRFETTAIDDVIERFVRWLAQRRKSISELPSLPQALRPFLIERFGSGDLQPLCISRSSGCALYIVHNSNGSNLIHAKRSSIQGNVESIAAIRILHGIARLNDQIFGPLVTTSFPLAPATYESRSRERRSKQWFYRHVVPMRHPDRLVNQLQILQADHTAYAPHLTVGSFDDWVRQIALRPFKRFRRIVS